MTTQEIAQIKTCYWKIVAAGELERVGVRARIAYLLTQDFGWDQGKAQKTMASDLLPIAGECDFGNDRNVCLCDGDENGKCICPYTNEYAPADKLN